MAYTNKNRDTHNICLYMRDDIKRLAENLARKDGRTLSNFISQLIVAKAKQNALISEHDTV